MDDGALDRLEELFTTDVAYDLSDFGLGPLSGPAAIRAAALAVGEANPLGHHVTNVIVTGVDGDVATARSNGIGIRADGTCGSVTYDDTRARQHRDGWRISHRRVLARRAPLGGAAYRGS